MVAYCELILNSCGDPVFQFFFLLRWASLIEPSQKINNQALDSQSSPSIGYKSRTYGTGFGIK
jgi:hypothetical protein